MTLTQNREFVGTSHPHEEKHQDREHHHQEKKNDGARRNVGESERIVSLLAGTGLIAAGLAKRTWGGAAAALLGSSFLYRGATGYCSLYRAAGVSTAGIGNRGHRLESIVTVNKQPQELFRFWRKLENLPRFMKHIESVTQLDEKTSHWVAKGSLGVSVKWDAAILREKENELIAWQSLPGSDVYNAGVVRFRYKPGTGTKVSVRIMYTPPGGKIGDVIAHALGEDPAKELDEDLNQFKRMAESGQLLSDSSV